MKKGLTLFAAILTLFGCNSQKKSEANEETKTRKYLVIYYSQTGTTQQVAREFARLLDADTLRIDAAQPYNGTYDETIERCKQEMANNELPELAAQEINLDGYDVVFLGYPNWWYGIPMALYTFFEENDLSGKQVYLFCSHGTGGLARSVDQIREALPDSTISENVFDINEHQAHGSFHDVQNWLLELGFQIRQN